MVRLTVRNNVFRTHDAVFAKQCLGVFNQSVVVLCVHEVNPIEMPRSRYVPCPRSCTPCSVVFINRSTIPDDEVVV